MFHDALAVLGNVYPNGWLIGGMCWMVLRLIGRMDTIEREQAETREALDALHGTIRALEAKIK